MTKAMANRLARLEARRSAAQTTAGVLGFAEGQRLARGAMDKQDRGEELSGWEACALAWDGFFYGGPRPGQHLSEVRP